MIDYAVLHKKARHDVRICLQVWTEVLLSEFGEEIDYLIVKGSAMREWTSYIDYVPVVSDIDLHIRMKGKETLFDTTCELAFTRAIGIAKKVEEEYIERNPERVHVPRSQLILVNEIEKKLDPFFVPSALDQVVVLLGDPSPPVLPSPDIIRSNDLALLRELQPVLERLPMSAVDRAGLDYWGLLRRLSWKVSPTPVRLLTQTTEDPLEIWSLNRTAICAELEMTGYAEIANEYKSYYDSCWDMFLSNFSSSEAFRQGLIHAYNVLRLCYEASLHLEAK